MAIVVTALNQLKEGDWVRFVRMTDDHLHDVQFIFGVAYVSDGTVFLRYAGKPEVNHKADMRTLTLRQFVGDSWTHIEGYFTAYSEAI